jgi:hypothetical protein
MTQSIKNTEGKSGKSKVILTCEPKVLICLQHVQFQNDQQANVLVRRRRKPLPADGNHTLKKIRTKKSETEHAARVHRKV